MVQTIEALTVRRTTIADASKARYRVYTSPTEFVAVIAESALMAVKVAGISQPHRIVRDLPTEGVAIDAERYAHMDAMQKIALGMKRKEQDDIRIKMPQAKTNGEVLAAGFVPLHLRDLDKKSNRPMRILSPEEATKLFHFEAPPPPPSMQATPMPPAEAVSVPEPVAAPVEVAPTPEPEPEPVLEAAPTPPAQPAAQEEGVLSPEEVEKLLNG